MNKLDKLIEKIYANIEESQEKIFMAFVTLDSEKMWKVNVHFSLVPDGQRIEEVGTFSTKSEALEALDDIKRSSPSVSDYNCFIFNVGEDDG